MLLHIRQDITVGVPMLKFLTPLRDTLTNQEKAQISTVTPLCRHIMTVLTRARGIQTVMTILVLLLVIQIQMVMAILNLQT